MTVGGVQVVCRTQDYEYHFGSSNASFKAVSGNLQGNGENSGQVETGEIPWIL